MDHEIFLKAHNKLGVHINKLSRETMAGNSKRALCNIAHPSRSILLNFTERMELYMGRSVADFKKQFTDEATSLSGALHEACCAHDDAIQFHDLIIKQCLGQSYFDKYIACLPSDEWTYETCVLTHLLYYRYLTGGGRYFQTSTDIDDLLLKTDISGKYPLKYFKLPYRNIYIECRNDRSSPLYLRHPQSGKHIFEGAYISEVIHPKYSWEGIMNNSPKRFSVLNGPVGDSFRSFEICLIGSAATKKDIQDDMYHFLMLSITDEEQDLLNLMEQHRQVFKIENPSLSDYYTTELFACIEHIAKVILFLNTNQSSLIEINEKILARKEFNKYPSSSIKKKLAREKMKYASNKIYISMETDDKCKGKNTNSTQRGVKTHWRRGHFRFLPQKLPQRPSDRTIWIKPMLINGSSNSSPSNKDYVLN